MRLLALLLTVSAFDRVTEHVTGTPWTYGIVLAVSAVDAFFPAVPAETAVIAAGTLAAGGDLLLYALIPAAAVGAFLGDNVSYLLGATLGERASARLFTGERSRRRLRAASRTIDRHGAAIIVAARFVPGGRTATTFSAGMLALPWRRFAVYDAIAASVWALYAGLVGYLGGAAFRDDLWKALALSFGIAIVLTMAVEGWRRLQGRRGNDLFGEPERP